MAELPLHVVVRRGNVDELKTLLKKRPSLLLAKDHNNQSALHVACGEGDVALVAELLQHKIPINVQDVLGWTALHHAIHGRHFAVAELLLDHHADVNLTSKDGSTPLHFAAQLSLEPKSEQALFRLLDKMLLCGGKLDTTTSCGETVIHRACLNPRGSILLYLLDNARSDLNIRTEKGFTCLHYAIINKKTEAAKLMLQRGADPTISCSQGSMVKLAEQFHATELIPHLTTALNPVNTTAQTAPGSPKVTASIEEEYDEELENLLVLKGSSVMSSFKGDDIKQVKQASGSPRWTSSLRDVFFKTLESDNSSSSSKLLFDSNDDDSKRILSMRHQMNISLRTSIVSEYEDTDFQRNQAAVQAMLCQGEKIEISAQNALCVLASISSDFKLLNGDYFLTNFQLIFISKGGGITWNSPILSINQVQPVGEFTSQADKTLGFYINRKDFDVDIIIAASDHIIAPLILKLKTLMACQPLSNIFAYWFGGAEKMNKTHSTSYDAEMEYERLNLNRDCWRLTTANSDYEICDTYPTTLAVPKGLQDT